MSKGLQVGKSLKNFGNSDAFYWDAFIKHSETKYFSARAVSERHPETHFPKGILLIIHTSSRVISKQTNAVSGIAIIGVHNL
jgi:hypothetical protein